MKCFFHISVVIASVVTSSMQLKAKEIVATIDRTAHRPVIDGILDDSTWLFIEPINGFQQYHPMEGLAPSESTKMYIAYDQDYFYLAFRCYDSEMDGVRATLAQRESWDNDDCVGFAFDTYNSEREGFLFNINPYGIPCDFIWHHDGYCDNGWDSDVRSKGALFSDCYCIEAAVPFKSLRMPAKDVQEWGFYALRSLKRKGEMVVWPPRTHSIPNLLAQASLLKGLQGIEMGRSFAFLPYIFSSYSKAEDDRPMDAGLDFRYGVTSDIMFDVTVNPDYSHIEADPDRIELTERYAQTYPEKRPFFTEGTDIFVSNQALFYSRSIVNPIGGLKITGRLGRNRFGFLSALDDVQETETKHVYNHLRVKIPLSNESTIGAMATNKDGVDDGNYNRAFSVDGVLRFWDIYSFKSQVTRTSTRSDSGRSAATGYSLNMERFGSSSYNKLWYNDFPDNFQTESGSMWDVIGFREVGTHNSLFIRRPFEEVNEFGMEAGMKGRFDHQNDLQEEYLWAATEVSLDNLWTKLTYYKNHESEGDNDFRYSAFEYEVWSTPTRYLEYALSAIWGGAAHYEEMITGWKWKLAWSVIFKPLQRVVYTLNISREDFYREYGGSRVHLQTIVWNKLSFHLMPGMFFRGIYQYNSIDRTSDASLLYAYEYSPLSNIYAGTNFNDFSTVHGIGDNVEVFVKVGYLWRL